MKVLFFDTETNGLPHVRNAPITLVENWPRVISLAWQLCEVSETGIALIDREYFIIKPSCGIEWSAGAEKIHGITYERAEHDGVYLQKALELFLAHASKADAIIAHNMAFDKPIVLAEFVRNNMPIDWWPKKEYCTMESTKGLCKLPPKTKFPRKNDPYKFPSLSELHTFLFGDFTGFDFHSASEDVRCLVKCFAELLARRVPVDFLSA